MKKQPKILISIDESKHSEEIFKFIAENSCYHSMNITLFHVLNNMPLFLQDAGGAFPTLLQADELERFRELKIQIIDEFIRKGKKKLLKSGVDEKNIQVKVTDKAVGIARDILSEAASGYDLVVVGRRGIGKLKEIFLGSVSAKIVEKSSFAPVMIMGSCQPLKKIYIAFDGSESSLKAVKFVGDIMGKGGYPITLIHVLRIDDSLRSAQIAELFQFKSWLETVEKDMRSRMEASKNYLVASGIPAEKIDLLVIKDADSRAGGIVQEIINGGPCIIVMGRRGISKVEEFVMGRVSSKVIQMAKSSTICIVPEQYSPVNE